MADSKEVTKDVFLPVEDPTSEDLNVEEEKDTTQDVRDKEDEINQDPSGKGDSPTSLMNPTTVIDMDSLDDDDMDVLILDMESFDENAEENFLLSPETLPTNALFDYLKTLDNFNFSNNWENNQEEALNAVKNILENDSSLNINTKENGYLEHTAVSICVEKSYPKLVHYLVTEKSANIDIPNNSNETPLSLCAEDGDEAMLRQLLAYGPNPLIANDWGETASQVAKQRGWDSINDILIEYEKDYSNTTKDDVKSKYLGEYENFELKLKHTIEILTSIITNDTNLLEDNLGKHPDEIWFLNHKVMPFPLPLDCAISACNYDAVNLLLSKGANLFQSQKFRHLYYNHDIDTHMVEVLIDNVPKQLDKPSLSILSEFLENLLESELFTPTIQESVMPIFKSNPCLFLMNYVGGTFMDRLMQLDENLDSFVEEFSIFATSETNPIRMHLCGNRSSGKTGLIKLLNQEELSRELRNFGPSPSVMRVSRKGEKKFFGNDNSGRLGVDISNLSLSMIDISNSEKEEESYESNDNFSFKRDGSSCPFQVVHYSGLEDAQVIVDSMFFDDNGIVIITVCLVNDEGALKEMIDIIGEIKEWLVFFREHCSEDSMPLLVLTRSDHVKFHYNNDGTVASSRNEKLETIKEIILYHFWIFDSNDIFIINYSLDESPELLRLNNRLCFLYQDIAEECSILPKISYEVLEKLNEHASTFESSQIVAISLFEVEEHVKNIVGAKCDRNGDSMRDLTIEICKTLRNCGKVFFANLDEANHEDDFVVLDPQRLINLLYAELNLKESKDLYSLFSWKDMYTSRFERSILSQGMTQNSHTHASHILLSESDLRKVVGAVGILFAGSDTQIANILVTMTLCVKISGTFRDQQIYYENLEDDQDTLRYFSLLRSSSYRSGGIPTKYGIKLKLRKGKRFIGRRYQVSDNFSHWSSNLVAKILALIYSKNENDIGGLEFWKDCFHIYFNDGVTVRIEEDRLRESPILDLTISMKYELEATRNYKSDEGFKYLYEIDDIIFNSLRPRIRKGITKHLISPLSLRDPLFEHGNSRDGSILAFPILEELREMDEEEKKRIILGLCGSGLENFSLSVSPRGKKLIDPSRLEEAFVNFFIEPNIRLTSISQDQMSADRKKMITDLNSSISLQFDQMNAKLDDLLSYAIATSNITRMIYDESLSHTQMLTQLMDNQTFFPKIPIVIPEAVLHLDKSDKSYYKRTKEMFRNITHTKLRMFFMCPVSGIVARSGEDGNGYELDTPKEWVIKYGPYLKWGMMFVGLLVSIAGGLVTGGISSVVTAPLISFFKSMNIDTDKIGDFVAASSAHFDDAMTEIGKHEDGVKIKDTILEKISGEVQEVTKVSDELGFEEKEGGELAVQGDFDKNNKEMIKGFMNYSQSNLELYFDENDKDLVNTGLFLCKEGKHGVRAWISEDSVTIQKFKDEGVDCLIYNQLSNADLRWDEDKEKDLKDKPPAKEEEKGDHDEHKTSTTNNQTSSVSSSLTASGRNEARNENEDDESGKEDDDDDDESLSFFTLGFRKVKKLWRNRNK